MTSLPLGWRAVRHKYAVNGRLLSFVGRLLHMGLVQAGAWIDEIPGQSWPATRGRGPVFILGHQRSATTFMHRTIAASDHAIGSTLSQLLLPALCLWRLIRAGSALDASLGGHFRAWIDRRQDLLLQDLDALHRIRLSEIEEDEFFFWMLFRSGMCATSDAQCLVDTRLRELCDPETRSLSDREKLWLAYSQYLQKLACFSSSGENGVPRWIVCKSPMFSRRIPELLVHFPDASFIIMHREPARAIASRLQLVQQIWSVTSRAETLQPEHVEILYQDSLRTYRRLERDSGLIPAHRLCHIGTEELRCDQQSVFNRVDDMLDTQLSSRCAQPEMRHARAELSVPGLTPDRISADLADIYRARRWEG